MEKILKAISILKMFSKFIVALIASLGVLAVALENGLTTDEVVSVAISFLGALGVYQVRNTTEE